MDLIKSYGQQKKYWQAWNRSAGMRRQSYGKIREDRKGRNMRKTTYESTTNQKKPFMLRDFRRHSSFNLQIFAEEGGAEEGSGEGDGGSGGGSEEGDAGKKEDPKGKPKTYSDADLDRIIAKKKADWEKQHAKDLEDAKEEARKYERMSKEQREEADKKKAADEAAKKDARIKELEQQIATDALRKSVAQDVEAMPEGITASQDFLDLVVTGDADAANANVKKLVGIILADRKAQEEKRATGSTPRKYGNDGSGPVDPYTSIANKYNKER